MLELTAVISAMRLDREETNAAHESKTEAANKRWNHQWQHCCNSLEQGLELLRSCKSK